MVLWSLLLSSLLLSIVSTPPSANAKPRNGSGPGRFSRSSPLYHVEAEPIVLIEDYPLSRDVDEENNWDTAKRNNSKKKLQEIINNLKEKCKINLSGTFNNIASLIRALKKLEAEELAACNISREAANLRGNYFLISAEAIDGPAGELIHTEFPYFEEFAPPEFELIEEHPTREIPAPKIELIEKSPTEAKTAFAVPEIEFIEEPSTEAERGPDLEFFKEPSAYPVTGIASPEMESPKIQSEDSKVALVAVPEFLVEKQLSHPIPAIGYVSPEMELAELKPAASTIAPIPDLGFISPDMAKHEIEYHLDKRTTATVPVLYLAKPEVDLKGEPTHESLPEVLIIDPGDSINETILEVPALPVIPMLEYEEMLIPDPDERKIQRVLQNFQRATQEDQQHRKTKKKGRRMSKRNEPSDDFEEDNWSQVEKDQRAEDLEPSRSLSDFDIDNQESTEENLSENDSDIVEEKLDELEANIISDTNEDNEVEPMANGFEQSDSNEEAFDELMEELDTPDNDDQNEGSNLLNDNLQHKYTDEEMVQNSVNKLQSDQLQEEITNNNISKPKHVVAKQSLRDMVEDLIAASLIAVFVILALIAMFYTVSFVRAKEKEKCPTITIIESGPPDGTRKYTVGSSRKHGSPVCYGKIVRSPRQRQVRHKHERMPVRKTVSSNNSTESSNRTTETMTLPPPQIISTCPRPLRSHISRAHSPRPLSPYPVCPCAVTSQLPSRQQTLIPSSQQQYKCKRTKKPGRRDTALPDYQASHPTTTRTLSLKDVDSPTSQRDKPLPDHQASQPTSPRKLSLQDVELPALPRDKMLPDYQDSHLTTPRQLSLQDRESALSARDATLPDHQASQPTSPRRLSLQDVGSAISTRNTDLAVYQESPLASVPRNISNAGLPVSAGDTTLPDDQDPHQTTSKRIAFYDVSDTTSGYQPSYQPSSSRMLSMDEVALANSARDTTLPGYQPSYLPSPSRMVSVDNAALAASAREMTLPDYQAPSCPWKKPLSAVGSPISTRDAQMSFLSDKGLVRNINLDFEQKQLSQSAPLSPVRSAMMQQASMQFPYQPDENGDSQYPLSIMKTRTKSIALLPSRDQFEEHSETLGVDSPERSSRSAYISDEGDIVSVESYADPSSATTKPIISSQHAALETPLSPFIPQPASIQPAPLSLSYGSLAPKFLSPHPPTQRARSKSVNIPMAPLSPFQPNQYAYKGSMSARDLSPRLHYIPKESDAGIISPEIVQSSAYPLDPLPQGQNQQPITQSQLQYQSPSLSPSQQLSSLSSPYFQEESKVAYTPSRQQIAPDDYSRSAYIPDERAPSSISQGPQCPLMKRAQQPPVPFPTASQKFVEQQAPSYSYGGVAQFTKQDLPNMDTSYGWMPYSASYISQAPLLQGWISTGSPTVGEVSISNIPSQGGLANIPPDNLQSRHDSFHPSTAFSPSAYSVPQQLPFVPSHQQLSARSQQSDVYSRSQGTLHSPLPNVPPPLSPSIHTHSQSLQQPSFSFPPFQPLSPLSLTFLREPAAVPSGSQSSRLQDSFRTNRFEDSGFLKGSPVSQSFIFKDYSSPLLSPVAPVAQSFSLTPRRYSYGDDDVFTYPEGSKHLASTPKKSRSMSVGIAPEVFHTALNSTTSISSESTEESPYSRQSALRSMEDSFPTSSESVYHVPPSSSFKEKYTGLSSDYSINEIGSNTNHIPGSHYHSAKGFFNDSSDYTNSD